MSFSPLYLLPLAPLAFVAFWCLIVKGLSLAGWQRLATHFAVPELPPGPRFSFGQGAIGGVSYRGAVTASVSAEGLGLKVLFLFRVGHPPLLIPWAALGPVTAEKVLWQTLYSTNVTTPQGGTVSLRFSSDDLAAASRPFLPPA